MKNAKSSSVRCLAPFLILVIFFVFLSSCKKGPGDGGDSSITGYVHVSDYNATFLILQGEYPGADEDVYIIYGDDPSFSDRTKTSFDGRFEFKYLRKGKYTVYVYSADPGLSGKVAVSKTIEITDRKQTVDTDTLNIKKN